MVVLFFTRQIVCARKIGLVSEVLRTRTHSISIGRAIHQALNRPSIIFRFDYQAFQIVCPPFFISHYAYIYKVFKTTISVDRERNFSYILPCTCQIVKTENIQIQHSRFICSIIFSTQN